MKVNQTNFATNVAHSSISIFYKLTKGIDVGSTVLTSNNRLITKLCHWKIITLCYETYKKLYYYI